MKDSTPEQYTDPANASKGYSTQSDGKVFPTENSRKLADYIAGQGSRSFEENQGVVREGFKPSEAEYGDMGQSHLQKLKATGSFAI